jgi:aminobenzoyl-glutamate transport protein
MPLKVCLGIMDGLAARFRKDAGIGSIVSPTLPCAAVLLPLWTALPIAWHPLGLPLGPA